MKKKIIFVFHNGHEKGIITYDCMLRIEAARQIAFENSEAVVCFVGGEGILGAQDMQKFWRKKYPELDNELSYLEKANNTADSLKEIAEYVLFDIDKEREVILISNAYHIRRIEFFAKRYSLEAIFVAAEDVLVRVEKFSIEILDYRNSFSYSWKLILEKIAMFYIAIDSDQKMVEMWRRHVRGE